MKVCMIYLFYMREFGSQSCVWIYLTVNFNLICWIDVKDIHDDSFKIFRTFSLMFDGGERMDRCFYQSLSCFVQKLAVVLDFFFFFATYKILFRATKILRPALSAKLPH